MIWLIPAALYMAIAGAVLARAELSRLPRWMGIIIAALWPIPAGLVLWERWRP